MSHNITALYDYPFQACWEPHNEPEGEGPLDGHFQLYTPRREMDKGNETGQVFQNGSSEAEDAESMVQSPPLMSQTELAPDQSSESITMQDCQYPTCTHEALSPEALSLHWERRHRCAQCGFKLHSVAEISKHHRESGHALYACPVDGCTSTFTRKDALPRHASTKHADACLMFPCTQRDCHTTFKRLDHLKQHLQGFHNNVIATTNYSKPSSCPHKDCEMYRDGAYHPSGIPGNFCPPANIGLKCHYEGSSISRVFDGDGREIKRFDRASHAFATRVDFQKHMRDEHNETPFECRARNCDRRRRHGFFRLRDLEVHQREEHGAGSAMEFMKTPQAWFELVPKYFWGYVPGHKQYIEGVIKSSSADWEPPSYYHDVFSRWW